VKAGLPQGSFISPILFVIYISGFFDYIEEKIPISTLFFADNISIIAIKNFIRNIIKTLEIVGLEAI
jgi:retron-type reverse transcriptase